MIILFLSWINTQNILYLLMNIENGLEHKTISELTQIQANTNLASFQSYSSSINLRICPVCLEPQQSLFLFSCADHQFCASCINLIIENSIAEFKIARCPLEICSANFTRDSPFFSLMSMELKVKYVKNLQNKQIIMNPQIRACGKVGCEGIINLKNSQFQCNKCKQSYCNKCLQIKHNGKCDQQIARGMQRKYKFRRCPNCKMVVQKTQGCDHMTCLCIHQFCYKCGGSYAQSHKCKMPSHLGYFSSFRWSVEFETDSYESSYISLSKILYYLEPDPQKPFLYQKIYSIMFTILIYPWLCSIVVGLVISAVLVYLTLCLIVIVLYFIFLPLLESKNMQLKPANYLQSLNVSTIWIRILMIPLFPVNFIFGLYQKWSIIKCSGEKIRVLAAIKIMKFFIMLPILFCTELQ